MTPIHSLPSIAKPRERLQEFGPYSLSLEELIAVIIGTGSSRYDVLQLSQQVETVLLQGTASFQELSALPGVGAAKASQILAALYLNDRLLQQKKAQSLTDSANIYAACSDLLNASQEYLVAFYINIRGQQIARETISVGTATASLIHPREVFRPAIMHNASHIVIAHNHPSGDPTPSQADTQVTKQLVKAGRMVGIEVLDHVVCGISSFISLRNSMPELFLS